MKERTGTLAIHEEVLVMITNERGRQERLRLEGKFKHTCASLEMSPEAKFTVLGEEVGEVVREVTEGVIDPSRIDRNKLLQEVVEVAAVATAWAESLVQGGAVREWKRVTPEFAQNVVKPIG